MAAAGPQARALQGYQQMANASPQAMQLKRYAEMTAAHTSAASPAIPVQRVHKPNHTGLPDTLKSGIESLSGLSMDHVKVRYNSDKPAQIQAHAYAQGSEIHVGPGQEKHLPHEAWHIVQQAQGRVTPTTMMKAMAVNDDAALEREADIMGAKALGTANYGNLQSCAQKIASDAPIQRKPVPTLAEGMVRWYDDLDPQRTLYDSEEQLRALSPYSLPLTNTADDEENTVLPIYDVRGPHFRTPVNEAETEEEKEHRRVFSKKLQYMAPNAEERFENDVRDSNDESKVRELLIQSLRKLIPKELATMGDLETMDFRQLEVVHAKALYTKGNLASLPSMKKVGKPDPGSSITHLDAMRKGLVSNPEETDLKGKKEALLMRLMPKLVELSHKIRLTHYYDAASEESILDSGRLQSKERRIRKAGGADVPNKSGKLDDKLGNTDHVFFFGEYEEDRDHPSPFRQTRFGGRPEIGDAILNQKPGLDGTERRVSFPLNSVHPTGVHGYVADLNSMPSLNPSAHTFSAMPMHQAQQEAAKDESGDAQGAHLLMDLLRQRFLQSNFPGNKKEDQMLQNLQSMSLKDLYKFLFRMHPGLQKGTPINPQILVPGSVPFQTPGVRFDSPSWDLVHQD
jgi:hypothetical protein